MIMDSIPPIRFSSALLLALLVALTSSASAQERAEWAAIFQAHEATGTMVVVDGRVAGDPVSVHGLERADQRFSPASTFKIAHTLFALDAGVVADEFQVFAWDGVERAFAGHNRNQDLRSAMRASALWVYEQFAAQIGPERAHGYLQRSGYGHAGAGSLEGNYWVDGGLAISAREQVAFLQRLYRNRLPFPVADQRLVKDLLIVEAGRDWILRAKTGWDGDIGWWLGWVEWPAGPVFFALNIDTPNRLDDLGKREQVGRAILLAIEALPGAGQR